MHLLISKLACILTALPTDDFEVYIPPLEDSPCTRTEVVRHSRYRLRVQGNQYISSDTSNNTMRKFHRRLGEIQTDIGKGGWGVELDDGMKTDTHVKLNYTDNACFASD